MNLYSVLINRELVRREFEARNVDDPQRVNQLSIAGGFIPGSRLVSTVVTQQIARREAEDATAAAPAPTVPTPAPTPAPTPGTTPTPTTLVDVPEVIGLSRKQAEDKLTQFGLTVQTVGARSDEPIDMVVNQEPAPPATVQTGTPVLLVISQGVVVPGVTGKPAAEARKTLEDRGFVVPEPKSEASTTVNEGLVIKQEPAADATTSFGGEVTLTVSVGQGVQVPDVVFKPVEEANKTIKERGLVVAHNEEQNPGVNRGYVFKQEPESNTMVAAGSKVTLTVSTGSPSAK